MNTKKCIPNHEKLWVWQKAHFLLLTLYDISKNMPRNEKFILTDQFLRSSKSVADNIAEGNSSYYFNEKIKYFFISRREAGETQNHIREMEGKSYIKPALSQTLIEAYEEVIRGINGLVNKNRKLKEYWSSKGLRGL